MKLEFVDTLPKHGTAINRTTMRLDVLDELVDALAGEAGTWAVYPWRLVRPDLAEQGLEDADKKVTSHVRQVQQMAKRGEEPFNEYLVEVAIRRKVAYIRVKAPEDTSLRHL